MKRSAAVIALAVAAMVLLAMLIVQSRGIPIEHHVAHSAALLELERITADHADFVAGLQGAWAVRQTASGNSAALRARLAEGPARLESLLPPLRAGAARQTRLQGATQTLTNSLQETLQLSDELAGNLTLFANGLTEVREAGPELVQRMREIRLDAAAADTFALVAGTLDYAAGPAAAPPPELRRLMASLQRDQRIDANMPADMQRLRREIEQLFATRPVIENRLRQLSAIPVEQLSAAVHQAARELYAGAAARTDQARTILSVYAMLLLAAAGLAGWRLHQSYRELNLANGHLAELNETLEARVTHRTTELQGALRDLQESQVQLVQAEKMSSLGQLVAGISHEINTPLLYLSNNAELIQERLSLLSAFVARCSHAFSLRPEQFGSRTEYQTRFVAELKALKASLHDEELAASLEEAEQLAQDSSEGLVQLTEIAQSLKDFSRLDRAPVASFDVNAGLDKTLLIANNIVRHKATVHRHFGELPAVQCSPSQINQVFLNLVTNAAQAIEQQGEIVITTALRDAEHVGITISDTGCGIPAENLERIRDPFFTTKDVGSGTGLGLSIVDEIVRKHGGQLLIESQPGKGSAFTVVLPIRGIRTDDSQPAQLSMQDIDQLLDDSEAPEPQGLTPLSAAV